MILPVCRPFDLQILMFMFLGTSPQSIVEALLALRLFMFLVLLMFLDPCNSFQVVSLSTLVVWSFLTLTLVLIRILTRMLYLLWALGAITTRPSMSLTGFTFPLMTPSPVSPPLLVYQLFVASSIVLVTHVALVCHP